MEWGKVGCDLYHPACQWEMVFMLHDTTMGSCLDHEHFNCTPAIMNTWGHLRCHLFTYPFGWMKLFSLFHCVDENISLTCICFLEFEDFVKQMNALEQVVPRSVQNPGLWRLMAAPPCLVSAEEPLARGRRPIAAAFSPCDGSLSRKEEVANSC